MIEEDDLIAAMTDEVALLFCLLSCIEVDSSLISGV